MKCETYTKRSPETLIKHEVTFFFSNHLLLRQVMSGMYDNLLQYCLSLPFFFKVTSFCLVEWLLSSVVVLRSKTLDLI